MAAVPPTPTVCRAGGSQAAVTLQQWDLATVAADQLRAAAGLVAGPLANTPAVATVMQAVAARAASAPLADQGRGGRAVPCVAPCGPWFPKKSSSTSG